MERELKTKGEQAIDELLQQLDPGSPRFRVLTTAKRFKSTWVELGEELLKVSRAGLFREWGYASFETYCRQELRLRQPTAEKLTHAYRYLEQEEPELLARRTELKPLPDYRSVDLLRQAREEHQLPPEQYAELRKAVIDDGRSLPTVRGQFRAAVAPAGPSDRQALQNALAAARRLALALKSVPALPPAQPDATVQLVALLEERLEQGEEA